MTPPPSQTTPVEPIRICLVEGDPDDARLVERAFDAIDRKTAVRPVSNGDAVAEALLGPDGHQPSPDLVILDLDLPGRDGCEVLQMIRDDPVLGSLPVLVLTGSCSGEDVLRSYDAKANAYLTKPTEPAAYFSLIRSVERFWFETARLPPVPS